MRITAYSVQFFILGKVLVLSHVFYVIYEIHHYAQLASFKRSQLHCVYKKLAFCRGFKLMYQLIYIVRKSSIALNGHNDESFM